MSGTTFPYVYPCVPGHEIVGRVAKAGSAGNQVQSGRRGGVGCLVDSDHTCPNCQAGSSSSPESGSHLRLSGQAPDGPGHLRRILGERRGG